MSKPKQNPNTESPGFGNKGRDELAVSYAEMLLSGKPTARRQSPHIKCEPKFTPRAKARFGRKPDAGQPTQRLPKIFKRRSWKTLAVWGFALVLIIQLATMVFNVPVPTLGGRQLWTDVRIADGWRVQCHAWTGNCRLLDRSDFRREWGDVAEMNAALDTAITEGRIKASRSHAVVLVHGLGRSGHSFDKMAEKFTAQGFEAVQFNYASTQGSIDEHAKALNRVLDGFKGVHTVSFVTHSLGGPVVRRALELHGPDMDIGRVVMLAPPNQGSSVARRLSQYAPFRLILGPALTDLASVAVRELPAPKTPFAIVAGRLKGESDGLVSIAETKLKGALEHLVVPASHTFIMNDRDVISFTADFIGAARS